MICQTSTSTLHISKVCVQQRLCCDLSDIHFNITYTQGVCTAETVFRYVRHVLHHYRYHRCVRVCVRACVRACTTGSVFVICLTCTSTLQIFKVCVYNRDCTVICQTCTSTLHIPKVCVQQRLCCDLSDMHFNITYIQGVCTAETVL